MSLQQDIEQVLSCLGMRAAVVSRPESQAVLQVGDVAEISRLGLFKNLFGGPEQISRLYASLDGQFLPQIWSQGGVDCFVSRLEDGTVYGIFSEKSLDPVSLYRASREAADSLEAVLRAHIGLR